MAEINITSATDRVVHGLRDDFEFFCSFVAEEHAGLVESEIELMLLASFDMFGRMSNNLVHIGDKFPEGTGPSFLITPQFGWEVYRIDFCIRHTSDPDKLLFIECDGHEFHERTKEQAERDRSKDRAIQAACISILRFTGREIWRDTSRIVIEILKFMMRR